VTALAARAPLWSADLFTLSLPDATTYHWTSADQPVLAGTTLFTSIGPAIERSAWSSRNTTEIPEMTLQLWSTGLDFGAGNNIKAQIHAGLLDGAFVLLQRAFMPVFGDTALGVVTLFGGLVGAVEIDSLGAKITCTGSNVSLEQNLPRRTYQATCAHTLYDAECTLSKSGHTTGYTVASANAISLAWTAAPSDPTLFLFGTMLITSGLGAGQSLTISGTSSAGVSFGYPLLNVPAPGDTFSLSEGCAKTVARCVSFGNQLNFGGQAYIPSQATGL
jgi:uncharacterized phage protein (TIGR02218 family)